MEVRGGQKLRDWQDWDEWVCLIRYGEERVNT